MNTLDPANITLTNKIAQFVEAQRGKVVAAPEIAARFSVHPSKVRGCISLARTMGRPICSNAKGYFWSFDKADLEKTIHHMEDRVKKQEEAIKGLKEWLE